jgi:acyl-CoA dehydrogenase
LILADTEQRVRHTDGIYVPDNTIEQLGLLEQAFHVVKSAEVVDKKVRAAVKAKTIPRAKGAALYESAREKGIINAEEQALLARAEELRAEAVAVDDFSQEEYLTHSAPGVLSTVNEKDQVA